MYVVPSLVEAALSSSRLMLSRFEVLEMRCEVAEDLRRVASSVVLSSSAESDSNAWSSLDFSRDADGCVLSSSESLFCLLFSSDASRFSMGEGWGLEPDTDLFVNERTEVVSMASSKVSFSAAFFQGG